MANVSHRLHAKVEMADGEILAAVIDERDLRLWDQTFKGKGWPAKGEAEFLFQGFIAAAAISRDRSQPNVMTSILRIMDDVVSVDIEADEAVPPTGAGPGNG